LGAHQKKFEALSKRRSEMTNGQQVAFDALVDARAKFTADAAEDVRDPGLGSLEHGAVVPDQRSRTPRQQLLDIFAAQRTLRDRVRAEWWRGSSTI